MSARSFRCSLAIFALFNFLAAEGRKTGSCPKLLVQVADDAVDRCNRDENCEGRKICCPTVRGRNCMAPTDARAVGRSEHCPPYVGSRKSDAVDRCDRDSDCPRGRYCCDSIVGNVCMKPEPAGEARSQGACPRLSVPRKADAIDRCHSDSECPVEHICCETVSGKVCMHPETLQSVGMYREGKCPRVAIGRIVGARDRCEQDRDCEDDWKCCQTVRGKMCLKPKD